MKSGLQCASVTIICCWKGLANKVTCFKALISYRRCCGELKYSIKQLKKDWASPGRSVGGAPRAGPYCPSTARPGRGLPREAPGQDTVPSRDPTSSLPPSCQLR